MKKDSKTLDKDYIISLRVPLSLHSKFDEWKELRSLPHGKDARSQINKIILDMLFNETALFDKELVEKLNKVFIEGTLQEKNTYIVDNWFEIKKTHPYLTTQQLITTESAGFLPLECVIPFYWEDKFLCFQCIVKDCPIDLPRLNLKDSQGHHIKVKITTPEFCEKCVTLSRQQRKGLSLFGHIKLEQLESYREKMKQRKAPKHELSITRRLQHGGMRMTTREAKAIFAHLRYDKEAKKWKGKFEASKATKTSRPTIDNLLKIFPEGLPVKA